jgi:hypothetical protein
VTDPLVILPNMEAVVSQFYRDQPEVVDLIGDRVWTAIPKGAGPEPLARVLLLGDAKVTSRPLWVARFVIQTEAYGGTKAQAHELGRTLEGVLHARAIGVQDTAVIVGVDGGSFLDLPDEEYEPARPRFLFTSTITAHPLATVAS